MHFPYPCALKKKGNRFFNRRKVLPYKERLPHKKAREFFSKGERKFFLERHTERDYFWEAKERFLVF